MATGELRSYPGRVLLSRRPALEFRSSSRSGSLWYVFVLGGVLLLQFPSDCPSVSASFSYVRLVGDRHEIEALTKVWDREVIDRTTVLQGWAEYLTGLSRSGVSALVYVNNHFAGFAPATALRLMRLYQARA